MKAKLGKTTGVIKPTGKERAVMGIEAVVEVNPQKLRVLRPFFQATAAIPGNLPAEAQIVLQLLFACFERQRTVKEGTLNDLTWGFAQAGTPEKLTIVGIKHLMKAGYVTLKAPDNEKLDFAATKILQAWVAYEPKLLELVYA